MAVMQRAIALFLALCVHGCASTGALSGPVEGVEGIAARYLAETPIAGMSVAIARDGVIVHAAGYGMARLAPDEAAGADTPFEFFSVAKTVTAALALKLAEDGRIDLDAPAADAVPGLDPVYAGASLRQLLRHTSGVAEVPIDEVAPEPRFLRTPGREALLAWLGTGRRAAAPDETWLYNNAGYFIAGLAAEAVAGDGYAELVQGEIAGPLRLGTFGYCPDFDGQRAQGYMVVDGVRAAIPPIDFGWFGGAGSLCGSARDLARWWIALRTGEVLSPGSLRQMMTPASLRRRDALARFGYGLGVRLGELAGHRLIGHTGNGAGGTAVLAEYPDERLLIIVLTNTAGDGVPHALEIEAAIAAELLELEDALVDAAVPASALAAAQGLYRSPEGTFCVGRAQSSLLVSTDAAPPVRLVHQGDGRFRRPGEPTGEEFFLGWPGPIEWFGYSLHGFSMDLAVRAADDCF